MSLRRSCESSAAGHDRNRGSGKHNTADEIHFESSRRVNQTRGRGGWTICRGICETRGIVGSKDRVFSSSITKCKSYVHGHPRFFRHRRCARHQRLGPGTAVGGESPVPARRRVRQPARRSRRRVGERTTDARRISRLHRLPYPALVLARGVRGPDARAEPALFGHDRSRHGPPRPVASACSR